MQAEKKPQDQEDDVRICGMTCELITIGDELLIGQTANTNAVWIGQKLSEIGVDLRWVTTVGDDAGDLRQALDVAMGRADVVITTGGLGPTHDDITKTVVTDYFGGGYVERPEIAERIRAAFRRRGLQMPAVNEEQARVPARADIIPNPVGSAPGFIFRRGSKMCIVLPGVPAEMEAMMTETVLPMLQKGADGRHILHRTLHTSGIAESMLFEKIGDLEPISKLVKVAFLPKTAGVDIRLTAVAASREESLRRIEEAEAWLRPRLAEHFWGVDDATLEGVVADLLFEQKKTIAVAESCTGGLLAHRLTNISGSSNYFERGLVTYSNRSKIELLGVPEDMIATRGAVSPEVAEAMARGVRQRSGTDFGLSTTGIAGPTGGTPEKPVGLIYIGIAGPEGAEVERHVFSKHRLLNKERGTQAALDLLRRHLLTG
jgi:nicotinamide-nucleotide amidase